MLKRMVDFFANSKKIVATLAVTGIVAISDAMASGGGVTLPTTGLDIAAYVTAAITGLATVLAAVVGGYFAFLLVKKALRWAGKALG